jgi:hypothetical protein
MIVTSNANGSITISSLINGKHVKEVYHNKLEADCKADFAAKYLTDPNIEKVLVLSTAHITKNTDEWLTSTATNKEGHDTLLPMRHIKIFNHHYGYIMFITDTPPETQDWQEMPEMMMIIKYAQQKGCTMINLDRDAAIVPNLITFEW